VRTRPAVARRTCDTRGAAIRRVTRLDQIADTHLAGRKTPKALGQGVEYEIGEGRKGPEAQRARGV
jgi:hypothetical protein